jgi:protease-4
VVERLKAKGKKVVVSMGGLAASGAYYISAAADEIYAERTTVTGSIGVIATWLVLKGTLDKIGAEPEVMKSTHARAWKDAMSPFRKPLDYERAHLQDVLDKMQEQFEKVVTQGRGSRLVKCEKTLQLPPEDGKGEAVTYKEIEPLNGKIYLAEEAKQLGLIDDIGYEEDAIRGAEKLAGLTKAHVVHYTKKLGFFDVLFGQQSGSTLRIDPELINRLQTPQLMMLWKAE